MSVYLANEYLKCLFRMSNGVDVVNYSYRDFLKDREKGKTEETREEKPQQEPIVFTVKTNNPHKPDQIRLRGRLKALDYVIKNYNDISDVTKAVEGLGTYVIKLEHPPCLQSYDDLIKFMSVANAGERAEKAMSGNKPQKYYCFLLYGERDGLPIMVDVAGADDALDYAINNYRLIQAVATSTTRDGKRRYVKRLDFEKYVSKRFLRDIIDFFTTEGEQCKK